MATVLPIRSHATVRLAEDARGCLKQSSKRGMSNMNTRELIAVLNSLAENDLTNGSDIVEHPAHIAAITLMQNEGRIAELESKNATLKAENKALKEAGKAIEKERGEV